MIIENPDYNSDQLLLLKNIMSGDAFDTSPVKNSTKAVQSGGVKDVLDNLSLAMTENISSVELICKEYVDTKIQEILDPILNTVY